MSPLGNLAYRKRVFFMQRKSYILYHPFLLLSKPIDHMMTKLNESTLRARNWLVTDWPTPLSNCPTTYARADFCPFLDQFFDTFQITGMFAINLVDGLKGLAEIFVQYGWHCPLTSFLSSSWEKREQIKLAFSCFSAECTIKDILLLACSLITRASANNLDLILLGSPKLGGGKECCEFFKVENVRLSPPPRSLVSVVAHLAARRSHRQPSDPFACSASARQANPSVA